ncbi:MAG: tetratricopeptide repeat protein [Acidobacteria bacterium]|nr:tetratricopeptide repeat protein [Acidobacteriota bacterium]
MYPLRLLVLSISIIAGFGQTTSDSSRHVDTALQMEERGQFEAAGKEYKAAIESASRTAPSELLRALDLACTFYQDTGQMPQAENCLKRLMTTYQRAIGDNHLRLNRVVNRLGCLYVELGLRAKVERLGLEKWLDRVEAEDPLSTDRIQLSGTVAALQIMRGAPAKALALNKKAWEILTTRGETESHSGITILNNLAISYTELHRPSDAADELRRALRIGEKIGLQNSLGMAATLANLSQAYANMHLYSDAEKHLAAALEIIEARCGKDSSRTGAILATYAPLLRQLGRKPEAKAVEARARRIAEISGVSSYAVHSVDIADMTRGRGIR